MTCSVFPRRPIPRETNGGQESKGFVKSVRRNWAMEQLSNDMYPDPGTLPFSARDIGRTVTATFVTIVGLPETEKRKYYAFEGFVMELGKLATRPTYCRAIHQSSCRS